MKCLNVKRKSNTIEKLKNWDEFDWQNSNGTCVDGIYSRCCEKIMVNGNNNTEDGVSPT